MTDEPTRPLCVDLDGTFTPTDTLEEALSIVALRRPWLLPSCLLALREGRAALKHRAVEYAGYSTVGLPRTGAVHDLIENQHSKRPIWIVSGAPQSLVDELISTDSRISKGIGSTPEENLTSFAKRDFLVQTLGHAGFDYVGNSTEDMPVWKACGTAYGVNLSRSTRRRIKREQVPLVELMPNDGGANPSTFSPRPLSWIKNLLIFVPMIASHQWTSASTWQATLLTFLALLIGSTLVYYLNDLADVVADRRHPRKSLRPIASAKLKPRVAWTMSFGLALAWTGVLSAVNADSRVLLALQLVLSLLYSGILKQYALVDVVTLAILFGNRILLGGTSSSVSLSSWLIAFSLFIFLSLATLKRFCELKVRPNDGKDTRVLGHSYAVGDGPFLAMFGLTSMFLALLVLALYLGDVRSAMLYARPDYLWAICICILVWGGRIWLRAWRGEIEDDPLREAIRLPESWIALLLCVVAFAAGL